MSSKTPANRSKGRILVVDDDRLVLATLTFGLEQAGYDVLDADNGDDAILLARDMQPDLALLDIRMQGLSGFDVASYLREHLRIPFVFLSAFSDAQTMDRVRELGAVACLVKPLDIGQILPTLEEALGRTAPTPSAPRSPVLQQYLPMAIGFVMAREDCEADVALARLEARAAASGTTLADLARSLLDHASVK